ncbi:MAG TPA: AAA family ATPase, partial [Vicinamibacterales bacterium]|nr:AAA family ATPase [Vicinamibacterales bacterium]
AEAGTILISGQTHDLLKHAFVTEARGALSLKGVAQPVEAFRVIVRADARSLSRASRLVGREIEGRIVDELFAAADTGRRSAALVVADPGLGKSSLVQAALDRIGSERAAIAIGQCSAYDVDTALAPIVGACESLFGMTELGPSDRSAQLASLVGRSKAAELGPSDAVLLAGVFGAASPDTSLIADLSPQRRKELTFAAIAGLIRSIGLDRPVVLVVEDLHWADPSTIEFLTFLLGGRADARLLLLLTSRPSFAQPWNDGGVVRIELGPLSPGDVRAIVDEVSSGHPLPPALLAEIIARTDGVPLYVEELTKTLLESGATDDRAAAVPTSLHASLTARLDRLGPAREVAQLASVIGRDFSLDMLRATGPWRPAELDAHLDRLIESELVLPQGPREAGRFVFRHALIRDAAYDLLLKSARRDQHRRIADALIERFAERAAANPGLVARHLTEAGDGERAVPYWIQAGRKAAGESANVEAIRCFQAALDLVRDLPASPARDLQELGILLAIGPPLTATRGFVVDEVERTYLRAQELNERVGDPAQRLWIGIGLAQFRLVRGEIEAAHRLGLRLVEQAEAMNAAEFRPRALIVPAITSYYAGRFRDAEAWQARTRVRLDQDDVFLNFIGLDLGALLGVYEAMTAWHLGRPDTGLARGRDAIDRARRTGRSNALSHALVFGGLHLHHFRREPADVLRLAAEVAALSAEYGLPIWGLQAGLWQLWALSLLEPGRADADEETPPSLQIIRTYQSTGSGLALAYFMTIAIETLWHRGRLDLAGSLIDEALAFNTSRTDPMWDAEIRRLKGEYLIAQGGSADDAGHYFSEAIAIARRQESKALELRAFTSLVRSQPTADRVDELRRIAAAFDEGLDTADLTDVAELLNRP